MNAISLVMLGMLSAGQAEPRYYPLDEANVWIYTQPENEAGGSLEVEVRTRTGDQATVAERFLPAEGDPFPANEKILFERSPSRIEIDLPEEGAQAHYLFAEETWTHRDSPGCDDGITMRVTSRTDLVETPAGTFTDALQIQFEGGFCADAGTQVEWWVPDVGLVRWIEGTFAGPRTWVLKERRRGGQTYQRGDANGDGQKDISDAVRILNWLGAGGPAPTCLKSADVDASLTLNITDPIVLLNFLFIGGPRPPEPYNVCGSATGDEIFTCLTFENCST